MYYAQIDDTGVVVAITETKKEIKADNMILIQGYDVDLLGRKYKDGEFEDKLEEQEKLKTIYTHREFILRLGSHHAAIQRLRDENNALPPSQKNYELERLFQLWEKSQDIDLDDQDLHAAFDVFVGLDLMTRAEADTILTPNEDM